MYVNIKINSGHLGRIWKQILPSQTLCYEKRAKDPHHSGLSTAIEAPKNNDQMF